MTKVAYGKSQKWLDTQCSLCDKVLAKKGSGEAQCVFKNDDGQDFLPCLPCFKSANSKTAV